MTNSAGIFGKWSLLQAVIFLRIFQSLNGKPVLHITFDSQLIKYTPPVLHTAITSIWLVAVWLFLYRDDVTKMETFPALPTLCEGNPPVTDEFPSQRPVTRSFDIFFGLRNKQLSKQPGSLWFETQSGSLLCNHSSLLHGFQCNLTIYYSPSTNEVIPMNKCLTWVYEEFKDDINTKHKTITFLGVSYFCHNHYYRHTARWVSNTEWHHQVYMNPLWMWYFWAVRNS